MRFFYPLCLLLLLFAFAPAAGAQTVLTLQPESEMWIEGGSNKNDWRVNATTLSGTLTLAADAAAGAPMVTGVALQVPSQEVLSAKEAAYEKMIMNRLMHKTLKVDEHPEITYLLLSAEPTEAEAGFALRTVGNLTLGGVTQEIEMVVMGTPEADGRYRFAGSHELSMRSYGLEPPRVSTLGLFTKDEVTVHFNLLAGPGT